MQSAPVLPDYRINANGQTEVLVPGIQEYGLLIVPSQVKGGFTVRLVTPQAVVLDNLSELRHLRALGEQLTSLSSTLIEVRDKIPTLQPGADVAKAIADFKAVVSSKGEDTARIEKLQDFLLTWLRNLYIAQSDTIGSLSAINGKIDTTTKALTDKLEADTKTLSEKIDASTKALGDKIDTTNTRLQTLNQTVLRTLINNIAYQNIAMPQAQTEYPYALPGEIKSFTLRCSTLPPVVAGDPPRSADIWYSFEAGQVVPASRGQLLSDGTLPRSRKLFALNEVSRDSQLSLTGRTLYVACAAAGWTAELDIGT